MKLRNKAKNGKVLSLKAQESRVLKVVENLPENRKGKRRAMALMSKLAKKIPMPEVQEQDALCGSIEEQELLRA